MICQSRTRSCHALLVAVIVTSPAMGDGLPVVATSQGERFAAKLAGVSEDWRITFATGDTERRLPLRQLVYWGSYADGADGSQIVLTDGSVLTASILKLTSEAVVIAPRTWGESVVPSTLCATVRLAALADPLERDRQRERFAVTPAAQTCLFLRNGDEIIGQLATGTEEVATFGIDTVNFVVRGGKATSFPVNRVRAVTFASSKRELAPIACWLGFKDGSLLAVSSIRREGDRVELQLACGLRLRAAENRVWQRVTGIESRLADVTYLSDLRQADYKHFPFLTVDWPLGIDKNALGGRLRCGGHMVSKGLGMHPTSRVVYDLDRQYAKLEAELALDDQAGHRGSAIYRVLVERPQATSRKWKLAYTSPTIRGGDAALPISIDVIGATRMALTVEVADRGASLDYANWLRARLVAPAR